MLDAIVIRFGDPSMWRRLATAFILSVSLTAAAAQNPGNAWFGQWSLRAEDAGDEPETLIYSDAGNGAMRMESVEIGSVIVTRFDGTPVTDSGRANSGAALAVTTTSPTSYTWVFWMNGQPFVEGENTLSQDRQSFTEVSWRVDQPDKTVTLVYERR